MRLRVTDTGRGISPEFLPHVFDRFRQADASVTRKHGGLGLGLAISRQIVELHGGTITARSRGVGRGATFVIDLPARPGPAPTAAFVRPPSSVLTPSPRRPARDGAEPVESGPSALDGARVLVVDDHTPTRDAVAAVLEHAGAHVATAADADEAVSLLRPAAAAYDALVIDIGLPGRDGYELLREARALRPGVPAIALTAYARPDDRVGRRLRPPPRQARRPRRPRGGGGRARPTKRGMTPLTPRPSRAPARPPRAPWPAPDAGAPGRRSPDTPPTPSRS
jgi:CheY-like chemotaxis protein